MGFFKSKEEKDENMLTKYGLETLNDPRDIESVRKIASELSGTGVMEAGMSLSSFGRKTEDILPVYYQRTLVEQNWIMIRQLDKIAALLESIENK